MDDQLHDRSEAEEPSFPSFLPTSGALVRWCADRWGDSTFVVLGDERLTYAEAEVRSAALAKGLLAAGVGKGTRVGLLAPNGPRWVVGWLAATRIGALVPLLNTYSKAGELGRALRHADVAQLLTVPSYLGNDYLVRLADAVPGIAEHESERTITSSHPYLRAVWSWGGDGAPWCGSIDDLVRRGEAVPDEVLAAAEDEVTPSDPMIMVFSSGSTADPKAVVHTHGATVRHAHNLNQRRDLGPDDVLYTPMPLFWVGGISFSLIAAMHAGSALVFEDRFDPPSTLALLERERVTQVLGWPHMGKALAEHPAAGEHDLSRIRPGAATALPTPEHRQPPGPRATSLGMTETLGPHTFERDVPLPEGKQGSFGREVPGVEHRVVDPATGVDVAPGEVGEIWVRGYSLMDGIYKRERATVFTADGWYRTGDTGRFDADGHLFFSGRLGDVIKSSGMNVTPREVEAALEEQPEVAMAIVTGVDLAEHDQAVVAAVALRPGESVEPDELRRRVKDELASYKVPRHVAVFASQAELPQLDSGKVDRRALGRILAERFGTTTEGT